MPAPSVVIPTASASRRADRFRVCSKRLRASAVGRYSSREASRRNEPSPGNRPCHHRAGSKERAQHTRHGPAGSAAVMATTLCRHRGTLRASRRLASLLFGRHRAVSDYSVNGYSDSFGWVHGISRSMKMSDAIRNRAHLRGRRLRITDVDDARCVLSTGRCERCRHVILPNQRAERIAAC
jgi:hypothetical protein